MRLKCTDVAHLTTLETSRFDFLNKKKFTVQLFLPGRHFAKLACYASSSSLVRRRTHKIKPK